MKTKNIYLFLAFLGIVLPYSQFLPWLLEHGVDIPLLLDQIMSSRIASFGWLDVIVSALALFVFIFSDSNARSRREIWLPVIGTLTVGVSLGLPLYLYFREARES